MVVHRLSKGPEVSHWRTLFVELWKCEVVRSLKRSVIIGWEDEKGNEHTEMFSRKAFHRGHALREGSKHMRMLRHIHAENTRVRKITGHPHVPTQVDYEAAIAKHQAQQGAHHDTR